MPIENLYLALRGRYRNGAVLGREEFIVPLGIVDEPPVVDIEESAGAWAATSVGFFSIEVDDVSDGTGVSGSFSEQVRRGLVDFSEWLAQRDPSIFAELRQRGVTVDVFIGGWMDDSQFDLKFPPAMLLECGKRELEISIVMND